MDRCRGRLADVRPSFVSLEPPLFRLPRLVLSRHGFVSVWAVRAALDPRSFRVGGESDGEGGSGAAPRGGQAAAGGGGAGGDRPCGWAPAAVGGGGGAPGGRAGRWLGAQA